MDLIKNYNPNNSYGMHTVEVVLQAWDYRKIETFEIGGNCKGMSILSDAAGALMDKWEVDDEYDIPTIYLINDEGDELEYEIESEEELEDLIVSVRVIDFKKKEE